MKLQDQVCSFELAKRLKELGMKQESLFYWRRLLSGDIGVASAKPELGEFCVSAFTVAELGKMFPLTLWTCSSLLSGVAAVCWYNAMESKAEFKADTEASARAKMVIYLRENGLL